MVERTGTDVEIDSSSQTGSQSITVPTCNLMVALATGYQSTGLGTFGTGQIFGLGGSDFASSTKLTLAQSAYSSPINDSGQVYIAYLVSPTSGTQTFRWSLAGTPAEGMNLKILFYTNVDTADPITDSDKQLTVNADLTGLTAGSSDMMVGAAYKYNATFTSVNDSGQTALFNDVYNSAANGCAEKVGGTGFYLTGGDYTICAAIVIKAASTGIIRKYKTASTEAGLSSAQWQQVQDNEEFESSGFVKLRVEAL